jgi:hypothetical protein
VPGRAPLLLRRPVVSMVVDGNLTRTSRAVEELVVVVHHSFPVPRSNSVSATSFRADHSALASSPSLVLWRATSNFAKALVSLLAAAVPLRLRRAQLESSRA